MLTTQVFCFSKIQQEMDNIASEIKAKEHTLNSLIGKVSLFY